MSVVVLGLSHRSAPITVLESVALDADRAAGLARAVRSGENIGEAVVLATCNRVEVYADAATFHGAVTEIGDALAAAAGVPLADLREHLYVHYEDRAIAHAFSVACGLDSMAVGEGQILGQLRDALRAAQADGQAGGALSSLFQQALRVGKRAHSETGIDRAGQSLVTFGMEQLALGAPVEIWARDKKALVIGAGSMSSLAAATLARAGVAEIAIANRTPERAERLATILGEGDDTDVLARAVPMDSVPFELTRADVVVSCTGATGLVLTADAIAAGAGSRTGRPVVVDLDEEAAAETPPGPTSAGADEGCPLDLAAVRPGFSVMGEAAVAGMDAATLEQHAAWAASGTADRRESARGGPGADAELIGALAATASTVGRIPERRRPEPVAEPPRPEPVLFLLDLAMPRDIDAAAHRLAGVRLVDIESLAEASADAPMAADVDQVRRIVSDEVAAFGAAQRAAHITPTVVALRTMAADVVAGEIARLEGRLPGLDDKHRAEITQTVRRVVDKLLHAPTVRVKQLAAEPGGAGYADALRTLFDLDPETVASVSRAEESTEKNAENRGP